MNARLEEVKDSYSSFTPLERVHFVQQAFYDVNAYCSRLWVMIEEMLHLGL